MYKLTIFLFSAILFSSCKKDVDPIFTIPPTTSSRVQLNGIANNEAGSAAQNSVYLQLSAAKQKSILRSSWDISFFCGNDFIALLNPTSVAGAKVTAKTNLLQVNATDTIGLSLTTSQSNPLPEQLSYFDDINGDINKTLIPKISLIENDNKVIILNRGTGGGIAARPWIKLKITRNNNSYILQYANITETTFKSISINKDDIYFSRNVSFDTGLIDNQLEKDKWDILWSYTLYQANFGAGNVPYNFADVIAINNNAGVTCVSKIYSDATTAENAYTNFNLDSSKNLIFNNNKWAIGTTWRSTQPATGARQDRFYIIKDTKGNFYKLKCIAMGIGTDGGTRGKPEFKYALLQ